MRRKEFDPEMVRQLSMIGCAIASIAKHFHCSRDVIERRAADKQRAMKT
jgi:hypothetical protein